MKLLVNMIACQTPSRNRGIGRYTLELIKEMAKFRGTNEMACMADPYFSNSYEELRQEFTQRLSLVGFLPYYYEHSQLKDYLSIKSSEHQLASALIRQAWSVATPDVLLTPSLFEETGVVVPTPQAKNPGYQQAAIIFDFIPYIFSDQYLDGSPEIKNWYLERLNSLSNYDLLLAISESTRQDAIQLLKISPKKVVNISGAVSQDFRPLEISDTEKTIFLHRFGITRPFIFYLGGDNWRKNMLGALQGYAALPSIIRKKYQLVINNPGDMTNFRNQSAALGLNDNDVVIFDRVTDNDLLILYNLCEVFFFPSLYEGFGLPVLEAMACGAPTLAGNNSSLAEVVGRPDALFDANDPKSISEALVRVLTNTNFQEDLSHYGLERAKTFSWENSANRAWQAIENLWKENKRTRIHPPTKKTNRSHIAYVSPLPPEESGISEYSSELLPYLAKHFQIDLFINSFHNSHDMPQLQEFTTYSWQNLLEQKDKYATVVYQFGNSAFHAHMIQLEQQFPGVVVLHDFYLSHLIQFLNNTDKDFAHELNYSHGLKALIDYQLKGPEVIWDWPINWRVLRYAKAIITHSPFHKELIDEFYQLSWKPQLNLIPQLRSLSPQINELQKNQIRQEIGVNHKSFVFCSFGFIQNTKLNDRVIYAFNQAQHLFTRPCKLIFVGGFSGKDYQNKITDLIKKLNLQESVRITGYLDSNTYQEYLQITDVAIQLRQNSRGETSRAVLDCMANGIPVILNAHGTNNDYDKGVIKISDPVSIEELTNAMIKLQEEDAYRREIGEIARKMISQEHNPEIIASSYAEVINQAIISDDRQILKPAFMALINKEQTPNLKNLQATYAAKNRTLRYRTRILVDVSQTYKYNFGTGIQRVVKRIIAEWLKKDFNSPLIEPVYINHGNLYRATQFTETLLGLPEECLLEEEIIKIHPGDVLFMLDSSWVNYFEFTEFFDEIRKCGGKIITAVYDLIPALFPELCDENIPEIFTKWLQSALVESDVLVCISHTISEEVFKYRMKHGIGLDHKLDIEFFHLGADIPEISLESSISEEISSLTSTITSSLFISVGTIEPRKNHSFILDAFDELWQEEDENYLVFAGKIGWNVKDLERRIRNHPMLHKKFFFIENPTDAELEILYSHATALIIASTVEGFGLPIVEAALHKVPVIASDIPVFHEVAGEGSLYFSLSDPNSLIDAVQQMMDLSQEERLALVDKIKILTWKESAQNLLNIILENRFDKENDCEISQKKDISINVKNNTEKTISLLQSCACSQVMLESDNFQMWVERMKRQKSHMHRKLWEWSYIAQVLSERNLLNPGIRGLGFAVGQEPLAALFASCGCDILATDLDIHEEDGNRWIETNQHAVGLNVLNKSQICPDEIFNQRVSFRFVNMNKIDDDLKEFDFIWSSCFLEHLGSLEHGKNFIYNSIKCLRPGGYAVHTTEYNISSNDTTVVVGPSVIYRKRDIEEIRDNLHAQGHKIELNFKMGNKPFDSHVDLPPYKHDIHLRLELSGFICTSYGLIIQKAL